MATIKKDVIGINFLHGWIRAYRLDKSGKEHTWSATNKVKEISETDDNDASLKEIVSATNSEKKYASIVMDHPLLLHKSIDIPPMNERDLYKYISRKVDQFKEFDETAVFSYKKTSIQDRLFVSINYMPASLAEDIKQACLNGGLYLVQIMPFAMVRAHNLTNIPFKKDEMAALITMIFDKISLIIGKKNGSVFCERSLKANLDNEKDVERVVREVKRSMLYCKQQFKEEVHLVKVSKHINDDLFQSLEEGLNIPVEWHPAPKRFFWIKELLKIPFNDKGNILSQKDRKEMAVRRHTKSLAVIVSILWIGAIFFSIGIEYVLHNAAIELDPIRKEIIRLESEKISLQSRSVALEQLKQTVKTLKDKQAPSIPGWFLGYISNELPEELVLTKTEIKQTEDRWDVLIEGSSDHGYEEMSTALKSFCDKLQNGPFRMHLEKGWHEWHKEGYDIWLQQLKSGIIGKKKGSDKFTINGAFRSG